MRCSPRTSSARRRRRRRRRRARRRRRSRRAPASRSPVDARRGHRQARERPRPAQPRARSERHRRGPAPSCGARSTSTSRRSARAGAGRHRRGQLDLRRTLRHATRTGEITSSRAAAARTAPRPLLLLIDVSGSLREHTPDYLRFAWAAQAETFTFGTRLTRVTRQLRDARRRRGAGRRVRGRRGRRRRHAHRRRRCTSSSTTPRYADRARGALTIVLSDGLERGDPAPMVARRAPPRRGSRTGCCGGRRWRCDPAYRPVTRGMAAIRDDLDARRRARPPDAARAGAGAVNGYVDAHHHIWRVQDLPWLSGPMIPRIFGPYEPLQRRDYPADEYIADGDRARLQRSRSTCRPTGRSSARVDEVEWVHAQHERDRLAARDRRLRRPVRPARAATTFEAQAEASPLMRGCRLQLHWHEHRGVPLRHAPRPDARPGRSTRTSQLLAELGWVFELQVFPNQLAYAKRAASAPSRPDVRAHPRRHADRGRAVARARCTRSPRPRTSTSSSPARARSSTASTRTGSRP